MTKIVCNIFEMDEQKPFWKPRYREVLGWMCTVCSVESNVMDFVNSFSEGYGIISVQMKSTAFFVEFKEHLYTLGTRLQIPWNRSLKFPG
jgi:hypothetical protein